MWIDGSQVNNFRARIHEQKGSSEGVFMNETFVMFVLINKNFANAFMDEHIYRADIRGQKFADNANMN
jgi:hypothetical protein